ncbi:hypothetical protein NLI96_g8576 [Meripilus lineatus]|uniref:Uncharacterized protein n=1 Tax=Meripilus lineatus TaxID=2056292 RepID=A0AAD5V1Q7_9APHY|nr:hypothetical protein NLI96_g8576 [Physisporinus lineatus]
MSHNPPPYPSHWTSTDYRTRHAVPQYYRDTGSSSETSPLLTPQPSRSHKSSSRFLLLTNFLLLLATAASVFYAANLKLQLDSLSFRDRQNWRRSLGIAWDGPYAQDTCASYGTRPYNAKIVNVPLDVDPIIACADMPLEIHNKTIDRPRWCQRLDNGEVHGHWLVDFDEPLCHPYWSSPEDKGCTGYRTGFRRYSAHLWGWYMGKQSTMCATTPIIIDGYYKSAPDHCEDWTQLSCISSVSKVSPQHIPLSMSNGQSLFSIPGSWIFTSPQPTGMDTDPNDASETTPLLANSDEDPTKRRKRAARIIVILPWLVLVIVLLVFKSLLDTSFEPESIRLRNERWAREDSERNITITRWENKVAHLREEWDQLNAEWDGKERLLEQHYNTTALEWESKEQTLKKQYHHSERERAQKAATLEREFERQKARWEKERERYHQDIDMWEQERQRKIHARKMLGIAWEGPYPQDQCTSYGTRPYTAKIVNVPSFMDALEVCAELPIQIHNRTIEEPLWCEKLPNGEVHGHWSIDFDEPLCQPHWSSPENNGCAGYKTGFRRYSAHLWGWYQGEQSIMCASTPNVIDGYHKKAPDHCENSSLRDDSETTPLITKQDPLQRRPTSKILVILPWLVLVIVLLVFKSLLDNSFEPESIRLRNERWAREDFRRNITTTRWKNKIARLRGEWDQLNADWGTKERLLEQHYNTTALEWETKAQNLERQYRISQRQYAAKEAILERELDRQKSIWEKKQERYRQDIELWEQKRQKMIHARKMLGIAWEGPYPQDHCTSYGTRPYTAKVVNVPSFMDAIEVCAEMPIQIHNRTIEKPLWCEKLPNGEVHGHWSVDFNEPLCQPYWSSPENNGCTGYKTGFRRYSAHLWGWYQGEQSTMCASTPNVIDGYHKKAPDHCENLDDWVGLFDIPDESCA